MINKIIQLINLLIHIYSKIVSTKKYFKEALYFMSTSSSSSPSSSSSSSSISSSFNALVSPPWVGRDMSYLHCFLSSAIPSAKVSFLVSSSTSLLQVFFGLPTGLLPSTKLHFSPNYAILIPMFYVTKASQPRFH